MVKIKNKKSSNPDLYITHITIVFSIILVVLGIIITVLLCRLPESTLEKFIDNLSWFIGGLGIGIVGKQSSNFLINFFKR